MTLALYRRYRPATFAEVIGQEHVTEPLQQALRSGRIHHAYLFSGPRGCGKTSSARILARSLNCAQGPTPDPCGECESCVALAATGPGSLDVIEIDAASHGGVDDARDLRERAFYAPVSSRFKIYIVDEAHMVSREGFNALLKLVEEPPPHLKFVFATTEPDKVIGTIRSRTFHYPFRLVPPAALRDHLAAICAREGVTVDPLVLPLVVRAGAGSVRDALSVLDQLIAGSGSEGVTYAGAVALLGFTDGALLDEVVDAFAAADTGTVLQIVDRVVEGGHDPRRFAADLLERLRDLLVLESVPTAGEGLIDAPPDQLERMRGQAARFGRAALTRAAEVLNAGLTEMRGTTSPRLLLEIVCARILLPGASSDETALLMRLERVERRLSVSPPAEQVAVVAPAPQPSADPQPQPKATPAATEPQPQPEPAPAGAVDAAAVRRVWPDIVAAVKSLSAAIGNFLNANAQVRDVGDGVLFLEIAVDGARRFFLDRGGDLRLHEALLQVLGVDWRIEVVGAGTDQPAPPPSPDTAVALPDEDVDPDTDATDDGASDALSLVERQLGGKVLGEI